MPATYKYGFLPKNREKALSAADAEFRECRKACAKLEGDLRTLNERMDMVDALLTFGIGGCLVEGERRKKVQEVIGMD